MQEIERMSVPVDREAEATDRMTSFGWRLMSSQEIFSRDSRLETERPTEGDPFLHSVTETTHYVKLVFERDTKMPHYAELKALQNEYDSNAGKPDFVGKPANSLTNGIWFLAAVFLVGLALGVFSLQLKVKVWLCGGLGGIMYLILAARSYNGKSKKRNEYEASMRAWQSRHDSLPDMARALID